MELVGPTNWGGYDHRNRQALIRLRLRPTEGAGQSIGSELWTGYRLLAGEIRTTFPMLVGQPLKEVSAKVVSFGGKMCLLPSVAVQAR